MAAYRWGSARYNSCEGTSHPTWFCLITAYETGTDTRVSSGFEAWLTSVLLLGLRLTLSVLVGLVEDRVIVPDGS